MSKSYYYLVAGLPDIILDNTKKGISFTAFIDEISEQLTEADASLLNILRLEYDNKNLISIIEKNGKVFDSRGIYSLEELELAIKLVDSLPLYMQTFIIAQKEEKVLYPGLSLEDQLNWLYYDSLAEHSNGFLREYYSFDLNLRNILAGLNSRDLAVTNDESNDFFSLSKSIICKNEVTELIHKSNAPDFSLTASLPWVEKIISLDRVELTDFEKNVDTLRWDMLNDLTTFSYFQIETILAFGIKLSIVERWMGLEEATGKEKLERLLAELKTTETMMDVNS